MARQSRFMLGVIDMNPRIKCTNCGVEQDITKEDLKYDSEKFPLMITWKCCICEHKHRMPISFSD